MIPASPADASNDVPSARIRANVISAVAAPNTTRILTMTCPRTCTWVRTPRMLNRTASWARCKYPGARDVAAWRDVT